MKNIGKKGLILAMATSLSIFAGTEIVKNQNNTTTSTSSSTTGTRGDMKVMSEEHKQKIARMDELKKKLENGTATKEEQKEIAQFLNERGQRRGHGPEGDGKRDGNGPEDQNRISPERIEELKTKVKSGKLTTTEANEVLQLLERRGPRGPRPELPGNNNGVNLSTQNNTVK